MSSCSIFVSSSQNRFRHDSILNNKNIDQVLGSVGKTEEHRHKSSKQVKRCSFNTSFTVFVSCHAYNFCRDGVILVAQQI